MFTFTYVEVHFVHGATSIRIKVKVCFDKLIISTA